MRVDAFPLSIKMNGFIKITLCALSATLLPACSMDTVPATNTISSVPSATTNAPVEPTPPPATPAPLPSVAGPEPRISYSSVKVDGPYIAMTFDDGPNPKNTPKLLDLLAARHMKATFFVVGENAVRMPEIMKRIVAEGHEIGNHTWSHLNCLKSSDEKIRAEIDRTDKEITAETGIKPTLLRPPYGAMNPRQRKWVHDEFGYSIILWDVDPLDWKEPGVSVVAHRIISEAHSGSIILSHDIHAPTIEAMPEVFDALLAKGYKFVTVSELIAMEKGAAKSTATPVPIAVSPSSGETNSSPVAPVLKP